MHRYELGARQRTIAASNARLGLRAAKALKCYCEIPGTDPENAVTDLLTDLMHLSDIERVDFETMLRLARSHHEAELEGG